MWHPVWWLETLLAVSRGEDAPSVSEVEWPGPVTTIARIRELWSEWTSFVGGSVRPVDDAGTAVVTRRRSSAGGPSYADGVEQVPTIEDSRGVDISQIRRQLRMTVPERVRSMVEVANTMLAIQERAQASLRREL